jgi:hypothetical protein
VPNPAHRRVGFRFIGETMPSIYRISRPGQEPVTDVGSVEAAETVIRAGGSGRCHVD